MTIDTLLSLAFPQSCAHCQTWANEGNILCAACAADLSIAPDESEFTAGPLAALWSYRGAAASIIRAFKFDGDRRVGGLVAPLLRAKLDWWTNQGLITSATPICPVPPNPFGRFKRGRDLPAVLAKALSQPCWPILARRIGASQKTRDRVDRLALVYRGFFLKPWLGKSTPQTVVLLDDVAATGATLIACAGLLKQLGVKEVLSLVVGRA